MIDGVKLDGSYLDREKLLSNKKINWKGEFNIQTGEIIEYPIIGTHHNIRFINWKHLIELRGSLYKLRNIAFYNDFSNSDQFYHSEIVRIVEYLQNEFNIDPNITSIRNLDYGMILKTSKSPSEIILENIITWNGNLPTRSKSYNRNGRIIRFTKTQYELKIYDKGRQLKGKENLIKIEKKVIKNEYLRRLGISVLSDLLKRNSLVALFDNLMRDIEKLMIVDSLDPIRMMFFNPIEKKVWKSGINPIE